MKKILLIMSAVAVIAACKQEFTIVHMSDPQVGFHDDTEHFVHSDSLFSAAVAAINDLKPEAVIITGDLVNDPAIEEQHEIYAAHVAEIQAPVYAVPGNHDIRGYTEEKRHEFLDRYGYDCFAFSAKDVYFIGINSDCIKDGAVDAEAGQLEWLINELQNAQGSKHIVVCMHCPIIRETIDEPEDYFNFPTEKRHEYISLFKENGVDLVLAGHTHKSFMTEYEGIFFTAAGPVGNAFKPCYPGFNVIKFGRKGFSVEYVNTPGMDLSQSSFEE